MRKLDTSAISQAAQFFPKSGTLDHLQLAYQEVVNALAKSIIGTFDPTAVYILFGCVNSGIAPGLVISAGAVFYNGEIYLVDATNFFLGAGQVAIANFQLTYDLLNGDPVTFTDNVQRNVHQIRKFALVPGAAGTGSNGAGGNLPDYLAWTKANIRVNLTGTAVQGAYPNYEIDFPANMILHVDSKAIGDPGNGADPHGTLIPGTNTSQYNVTFPDVGTVNYIVSGSMEGLGDPKLDAAMTWSVSNKASNGFTLTVRDNSGGVQNLVFEYAIIAKS